LFKPHVFRERKKKQIDYTKIGGYIGGREGKQTRTGAAELDNMEGDKTDDDA
jgi:hypothetical protein